MGDLSGEADLRAEPPASRSRRISRGEELLSGLVTSAARPTCAPSRLHQEQKDLKGRGALKRFGALATGKLEARVGIEPTHKGFADLSLTTWVPRPALQTVT